MAVEMSLTFHWFLPANGNGRDLKAYPDPGAGGELTLSGYPRAEESYWFGEGVLSILKRRGPRRHPASCSAEQALRPLAPSTPCRPLFA